MKMLDASNEAPSWYFVSSENRDPRGIILLKKHFLFFCVCVCLLFFPLIWRASNLGSQIQKPTLLFGRRYFVWGGFK